MAIGTFLRTIAYILLATLQNLLF